MIFNCTRLVVGATVFGLTISVFAAHASASGEARPQGDSPISSISASVDVDHPVPLAIGEVVTGRLGNKDEGGKSHYWRVSLPAGAYKAIIDIRRADDQDSNIGGALEWLTEDGKKIETLGFINEYPNDRHRSVFRFTLRSGLMAILRYSNTFTVSDYWLGVFKGDAPVPAPFFAESPSVKTLTLGTPAVVTLRGEMPRVRDEYYSIRLAAGDYKILTEYKRADGRDSNVGGVVWLMDTDGATQHRLHAANTIDTFTRESQKLSLADDAVVIFKVRAAFATELVTLRVERFQ